jgi:hypothetical protein
MPIDDLYTDCIDQEAVPLTISRQAAPTLDHGRVASPGAVTTLSILASVQPMPTSELLLMPEGMRARGVKKVFTNAALQELPVPDRFDYLGATWEIMTISDWQDLGSYRQYVAVRVTMA